MKYGFGTEGSAVHARQGVNTLLLLFSLYNRM
jgi:hypothetical protein